MLRKIGEANPQSRPYNETLSAFADTISAYRRKTSHKSRRMVDQYIDQILVIDVDQEASSHGDSTVAAHNTAVSVAPSMDSAAALLPLRTRRWLTLDM